MPHAPTRSCRLILSLLLLGPIIAGAGDARACPEIVVPMDPSDSAFKSTAWKRVLALYKQRKHKPVLRGLRKTDSKLLKEVGRLFHPDAKGQSLPPSKVQRWLQRHVHTRHPGVLIHQERFTYPAIVWWAWADSACRAGAYDEAHVALVRLNQLRPGGELLHHRLIVLLRLGRADEARKLLSAAPPDAFLTPFLKGMLARLDGDREAATTLLNESLKAAMLPDRRKAVARELSLVSPD